MADVGLVPFVRFYPEQAAAETRVLTVRGQPDLPDDEYALVEAYCADAGCDCRRVMLNVVSRRQQRPVATISYGFDRDKEMAGPFFDPINPQSEHSAGSHRNPRGCLRNLSPRWRLSPGGR